MAGPRSAVQPRPLRKAARYGRAARVAPVVRQQAVGRQHLQAVPLAAGQVRRGRVLGGSAHQEARAPAESCARARTGDTATVAGRRTREARRTSRAYRHAEPGRSNGPSRRASLAPTEQDALKRALFSRARRGQHRQRGARLVRAAGARAAPAAMPSDRDQREAHEDDADLGHLVFGSGLVGSSGRPPGARPRSRPGSRSHRSRRDGRERRLVDRAAEPAAATAAPPPPPNAAAEPAARLVADELLPARAVLGAPGSPSRSRSCRPGARDRRPAGRPRSGPARRCSRRRSAGR